MPRPCDTAQSGHAEAQKRQSLAVYRMVFGQSRQDEPRYLMNRVGPDNLLQLVDSLRIDLSPRTLFVPVAVES